MPFVSYCHIDVRCVYHQDLLKDSSLYIFAQASLPPRPIKKGSAFGVPSKPKQKLGFGKHTEMTTLLV